MRRAKTTRRYYYNVKLFVGRSAALVVLLFIYNVKVISIEFNAVVSSDSLSYNHHMFSVTDQEERPRGAAPSAH